MTLSVVPPVFDTSLFIPELRFKRKEAVLAEMVACARQAGVVREPELLRESLLLRERLGSTAVGKGVAVPNLRSLAVLEQRLVVARSPRGLEWGAPDGQRVQLLLLALSPAETSEDTHREFVARAVAVTRLQRNRQRLLEAPGLASVAALLREVSG